MEVATTLISAATAVVVATIAGQITSKLNKWEKQKVQRELFDAFNKRFDALNESLNIIHSQSRARLSPPVFQHKNDGLERPKTWEEVTQDYLNLCSEEYLWYTKKLISQDVWKAWRAGILYYLKSAHIQTLFREESQFTESYYGFFEELDRTNPTWAKPEFLEYE
jgi:hypothetical protein